LTRTERNRQIGYTYKYKRTHRKVTNLSLTRAIIPSLLPSAAYRFVYFIREYTRGGFYARRWTASVERENSFSVLVGADESTRRVPALRFDLTGTRLHFCEGESARSGSNHGRSSARVLANSRERPGSRKPKFRGRYTSKENTRI